MSEDKSQPPFPVSRPRDPEKSLDDAPVTYPVGTPSQWAATAAGVIWIAFGSMMVMGLAGTMLLKLVAALRGASQAELNDFSGQICELSIASLFGLVFLVGGVQSIRGIAQDTLIKGMGSILLAMLLLGFAAALASTQEFAHAGMLALAGAMLLAGGALALVGRRRFKLWRKAQTTPNPYRN